jgi:hypothetical protein
MPLALAVGVGVDFVGFFSFLMWFMVTGFMSRLDDEAGNFGGSVP